MQVTDVRGWTDVGPDSRFRNMVPNVIITADMIANGEYDGLLGDDFLGGFERPVIYDDGTTKFCMVLTLYVHPVGAGALAIGPTVALATNHNGRLLGEDGAYNVDGEEVSFVAGALLSHYCETSSFVGSGTTTVPVWSTSLAEGDAIWLVRRGDYELKSGTGAVAINDQIVVDAATTGGTLGFVRSAAALSVPPVLAEIQEYITGYGGKCLGVAAEADGAENSYFRCKLDLPPRYFR